MKIVLSTIIIIAGQIFQPKQSHDRPLTTAKTKPKLKQQLTASCWGAFPVSFVPRLSTLWPTPFATPATVDVATVAVVLAAAAAAAAAASATAVELPRPPLVTNAFAAASRVQTPFSNARGVSSSTFSTNLVTCGTKRWFPWRCCPFPPPRIPLRQHRRKKKKTQ